MSPPLRTRAVFHPIRGVGLVLALVLFSLVALQCRSASAAERPAPAPGPARPLELTLSTGIRTDDLDWSIAGNTAGANPNILSELTWRDVESVYLKGSGRVHIAAGYWLRGSVDWGSIYSGSNQDSDFAGDDRTLEWSRSENNAGDGNLWDLSAALESPGWRPAPWLTVTPLLGFSYHRQNLSITDGLQTVSRPSINPKVAPLGPIAGLDSRYSARWFGPWSGAEVRLSGGAVSITGSFEYHYAYYRAEADWNLRTDLAHPVSFEHTAEGYGLVFSVGADYNFTSRLSAGLAADAHHWRATDGIDRINSAVGGSSDTRLNEVNWSSYAVLAGITYTF